MNFYWISALCAMFGMDAFAAQMPNPRSATSTTVSSPRYESKTVSRGNGAPVVSRAAAVNTGRSAAVSGRAAANTVVRSATRSAAVNTGRSAAAPVTNPGRSAVVAGGRGGGNVAAGAARAASLARATAVFNDVSKIGGGYAACRDAYATCMDQLCANANDTYRRCYCSDKFTEFRNTELALDQAKTLLMQFEDNNLNAVDKTADEVDAMYSATVGEAAIKNDVSGAQSILNEIGDLLSGRKKADKNTEPTGLMDVDFSSDVDDIWSGGGVSSIFDTDTGVQLDALEGIALYNASNKQCVQLVAESCTNDAVLNMATSAYNIMINQDCNLYQRKIDKQREAVKQTVRQAEKYLREARLEEYRAHNSADVNECVSKVKTAILTDAACGMNYERCLDYSGVYINQASGEPIYGPRLFQLTEQIVLDGSMDVLGANPNFNKFLDSKRVFAASALDTCRDMADIVWGEFKRTALIEIAQAQDAKIEEVKMSCVSTMKECYDKQTASLKALDDTTAQTAGALTASATRAMCEDKVTACAALYDGADCKFDKKTGKAQAGCGLTQLLDFVETVDNTRVAEGCENAVKKHMNDMCTPIAGNRGYPWNCIRKSVTQLQEDVKKALKSYCYVGDQPIANIPADIETSILADIKSEIVSVMQTECERVESLWYEVDSDLTRFDDSHADAVFYDNMFGQPTPTQGSRDYGLCIKDTNKLACEEQSEISGINGAATWDAVRQECNFSTDWYKWRCEELLSGRWVSGICYWDGQYVKNPEGKED